LKSYSGKSSQYFQELIQGKAKDKTNTQELEDLEEGEDE
jgi:hypothetical protein